MPTPQDHSPAVVYLLDASHSAAAAQAAANAAGVAGALWLSQRGSRLGWIGKDARPALPAPAAARAAWQASRPIMLPGMAAAELPAQRQAIAAAQQLMAAVLEGGDIEKLLQRPRYAERLADRFELLAASYDEGDPQEIVKLEFDALEQGRIVAENLWVKLSWLSYEDDDASLRFRFSFGMENYEDVAADPERQRHAAALTEALFPESAVITANAPLNAFLAEMLAVRDVAYVERIVYFNAPEGGAQFHHDVERGHLGVVFAQLSGRTAWLTLSREQLLDEIRAFLARPDAEDVVGEIVPESRSRSKLFKLAQDRAALADYLNRRDHDPVERLINRTPAFARTLITRGHGYILHPGDVMLLPQRDLDHCAWHAVYCLDEVPGQALSFAIRSSAVVRNAG